MVDLSKIRWNRYHSSEGPVFVGDMPVPVAPRDAPFEQKMLSMTSAAEGGSWNAVNMYDSGIVSVGAIQWIDRAPAFHVCDMLGEVASRCSEDALRTAFEPILALDPSVGFARLQNGSWRFTLAGEPVTTLGQQNLLYFGDASGNAAGSYTAAKTLRAKTWAACFAEVWKAPGAVEAQCEFTVPRMVDGFTWGQLHADLFSGDQPSDGWVGLTRALLLAFAVNAPAAVVSRYAASRSNGAERGSPEWCLRVLRGVVVGSGIDVWPARWSASVPLAKSMFGVSLPSYSSLAAGSWSAPSPEEPAPSLVAEVPKVPEAPMTQDADEVFATLPQRTMTTARGAMSLELFLAHLIGFFAGPFKLFVEALLRALGKK